MLLVEQLSSHDHSHAHIRRRDSVNLGLLPAGSDDMVVEDSEIDRDLTQQNEGSKRATQLTLGLVVHSLADGFALGAAALPYGTAGVTKSATSELSLVIFFALMVHKGTLGP